jgi:thiol-disulfide isomerase/thioredoxin
MLPYQLGIPGDLGMRNLWCAVLLVLVAGAVAAAPAAQKPVKADDLLKAAKVKAVDKNKAIFVAFGASWCEACHQLETFLAAPEVSSILDKYFVFVNITYGELAAGHPEWDNPGADALMERFDGVNSRGAVSLPFVALLDQKGKLIANSKQPGKTQDPNANAGFPTEPEEIAWFLGMIRKGAPALTDEEAHVLQTGLRKAAVDQ